MQVFLKTPVRLGARRIGEGEQDVSPEEAAQLAEAGLLAELAAPAAPQEDIGAALRAATSRAEAAEARGDGLERDLAAATARAEAAEARVAALTTAPKNTPPSEKAAKTTPKTGAAASKV